MSEPLSLFAGYGIEIEYMIVEEDSLAVLPIADRLLEAAAGEPSCDYDDGAIAWSNELVLHLVELKTNGPAPGLDGVADAFQASLRRLGALLERWHARLMPAGMHPWMRPAREAKLWPHEDAEVYRAYDELFDCHRHGWANVQATHLNLPFANEEEFGRLLAAVRLVLPILPGLAASSPVVEGHVTGFLDTRLDHYRRNAVRMPSMGGEIVPEAVFTIGGYREQVLAPIHADLRRTEAGRTIAGNEWVNARGAIARFDRHALEIRLLDVQECPRADVAIADAVACATRALVEERWTSWDVQCAWDSAPLVRLLHAATATGPATPLEDHAYAEALGCPRARTVGDLWRELVERSFDGPDEYAGALAWILERGTLAERLLEALGPAPPHERIAEVYADLCDCLDAGRLFDGAST